MSRITTVAKALQTLCDDAIAQRAPSVAEPEGPFCHSFEQELYDLLQTVRNAAGGSGGGPARADQISVTNAGFTNAQQVFDSLLYVPLGVAGFAPTVGVQLLGSTLAAVTLNWSYNKAVVIQTVAGAMRAAALRTLTIPGNVTATTGYSLSASDGTGTAGASTAVYFANNRFWFVGAAGLNTPPAGAASDRPASETRSIQFTLTAGTGQKIYYMRPARLGAGTYVVGGFAGGFIERTVSYTNAAGYTESYIIGESANTALGLTTVTVN